MAISEQVNVRVPSTARDLILRIARLLRDDTAFGSRLERFINEYEDASVGPLLSERVDRIERRLDGIERKAGVVTPSSTPPVTPGQNLFGEREGPDPAWTIGEGRGRRRSLEGERELERRIRAGEDNATIAKGMGLRPYAVQNRREGIAPQGVTEAPREG